MSVGGPARAEGPSDAVLGCLWLAVVVGGLALVIWEATTLWPTTIPTALVLGFLILGLVEQARQRNKALRLAQEAEAEGRRLAKERVAAERQRTADAFFERVAQRIPHPGLVLTDRSAEHYAAAVLGAMGFEGVRATQRSRDNGIDAEGPGVVAQVKFHVTPTSPSYIYQLLGHAQELGKQAAFFSLGGYSREAKRAAERNGIALFQFSATGGVLNFHSTKASALFEAFAAAQRRGDDQIATTPTSPPVDTPPTRPVQIRPAPPGPAAPQVRTNVAPSAPTPRGPHAITTRTPAEIAALTAPVPLQPEVEDDQQESGADAFDNIMVGSGEIAPSNPPAVDRAGADATGPAEMTPLLADGSRLHRSSQPVRPISKTSGWVPLTSDERRRRAVQAMLGAAGRCLEDGCTHYGQPTCPDHLPRG